MFPLGEALLYQKGAILYLSFNNPDAMNERDAVSNAGLTQLTGDRERVKGMF